MAQPAGKTLPVAATAAPRFRVAAEYALDGDLRHMSHHDEMRMMARTLTRTGWPVRYSQGLNPRPRIRLPLPRSVGMASACQLVLVELREPRGTQELFDSLAAALPNGCTLKRLIAPAAAGTPHAVGVEYAVELEPRDAATAGPRLQRLMELEEVVVQRDGDDAQRARSLDIRPYIETLILEGAELRAKLRIVEQRTARPLEITTALGLGTDACGHRVRRTEVTWDIELAGLGGQPAAQEGTELVTAEDSTEDQKA